MLKGRGDESSFDASSQGADPTQARPDLKRSFQNYIRPGSSSGRRAGNRLACQLETPNRIL